MALTKSQVTILATIEQEFSNLKEFTENKENESLLLKNLIGSKKTEELLNKTENLQKIFLESEDLKIKQAILNLFPDVKNKLLLIKKLGDHKENFEKNDDKGKKKIISESKKATEINNKIAYIYLRILYRKDSITNLVKFKQLISLTNEGNKKIIIDYLQRKLSDMGLKGVINFNNLNTLSDWEAELKEIKKKLPAAKVTSVKKIRLLSSNISIAPSEENPLENGPNNPNSTLHSTTTLEKTVEQEPKFLPSWETVAKQQQHIIALENALEYLSKEDDLLRTEKDNLEKEVIRLQDIKNRLENKKIHDNSRDSVLNVLRSLKLPNIEALSKENQSLKEDGQKIQKTLIEQENKLVELARHKIESDKKLLEAEKSKQISEDLKRNINEIRTKYNTQTESLETLNAELESTKKLLEKTQNSLSQKNLELENIATRSQATEQKASEFKKLLFDLNVANEKADLLSNKENILNDAINVLQEQNQQLKTELQQNLDLKTVLESKLAKLNEILRNDESENKETLAQQTLEIKNLKENLVKWKNNIRELNEKIEKYSNLLANKEKQLENLHQNLNQAQEKINRLQIELNQSKIIDSTKQESLAALKKQLDDLVKIKLTQETSIQKLNDQINDKENIIAKLKTTIKKADEKLVVPLNQAKLLNAKNKLQSSQKDDSYLQTNYANLSEGALSVKNNKSNKIEFENEEKQLKEILVKNIKHGEWTMPENETDLIDLEHQIIDEDYLNRAHHTNLSKKNSASSESSSRHPSDSSNSPTSKISNENINKFFNNFSDESEDEAFIELNSFIEPNSFRTSTHSSNSSLNRSHSSPDLKQFRNKQGTILVKNHSSSEDLINFKSVEHIEEASIVPIINSINGATLIPLTQETPIENIISNEEFQEKLKVELLKYLNDEYAQVFQDHDLLNSNSDLFNNLLKLESEELNRKTLANHTINRLLKNDDTKAEIRAVLTELHTQTGHADLLTQEKANSVLAPLIFPDSFINGSCANLLNDILRKNRDNAESLIQHAEEIVGTLNEDNHPEISQAFITEFLQIASTAAKNLFNDTIDRSELSDFKDKLQKISADEIKNLIFALSNKTQLLTKTIEKIHTNGLMASTYLDEVKDLASYIFPTLWVNQKNFKDHIAEIGRDLLITLCIKNLQTTEKANLKEAAKKTLEDKIFRNGLLLPTEHTETIKKATKELVTQLLETNSIKGIIEQTKSTCAADNLNLLEASRQKLYEQLSQEIDQTFNHYFPNVHLDPILEKINTNHIRPANDPQKLPIDHLLTEDEKLMFPSELQYVDSAQEFVSGLRVKYPHLPSDYESKIDDDTFKELRLILRKKALVETNQAMPSDNDIISLSPKAWLEKALRIVTNKSINLELDQKQQKNLNNEFNNIFPLPHIVDEAITQKSLIELTKELKRLYEINAEIPATIYKIISKIETQLKKYPHLVDDYAVFKANLNNSLPLTFPIKDDNERSNLNDEQITALLDQINHRLENDVSKWMLISNNIAKEITNDILTHHANQFGPNKEAISLLVTNALEILYKFHDLEKTLEERKKWKNEIHQLYALTEKLRSNNHFRKEINTRIVKLENMQMLKKNDPEEKRTMVTPKGVYLPYKCRIIANSSKPDLIVMEPSSYEVRIDKNAFYKQNALTIGQTVTFAQALTNGSECKWAVTRSNEQCLAYKTIKKFFRNKDSYLEEVSFAQMMHLVNSFKVSEVSTPYTLTFGNCSPKMQKILYVFSQTYNKLLDNSNLLNGTRILCHIKNEPGKEEYAKLEEVFKEKFTLHANELVDISEKLKAESISHQIIRSRG